MSIATSEQVASKPIPFTLSAEISATTDFTTWQTALQILSEDVHRNLEQGEKISRGHVANFTIFPLEDTKAARALPVPTSTPTK